MEPTTAPADDRLIDDALAGIDAARARAPRDFLLAIALVLGVLAVGLLAVGLLASGPLQDICLNLGSEVIGAWLTVVIIDGLWRRRDEGTSRSLETMARRLEAHRGQAMTEQEREAWRLFAAESRALGATRSLPARMRELRGYSGRLTELERQGNRTLSEFDPARADR